MFIGIGSGLSVKIKNSSKAAVVGGLLLVGTGIAQLVICTLFDTFPVYEGLTLLMLTGVGYVFTASTTLTMTEGREYIGAASAVFGALGFLFGGIVSPLVGIGNIMQSTMIVILSCAVIITVLSVFSLRRKQLIDK